jgi:3-dehydroquinate synthase II
VGRNKIERRPLLLVEAEAGGETVSLILQNAETIRLTTPTGEALSVALLKPGDQVLAHVESGGRHFGQQVEETITER